MPLCGIHNGTGTMPGETSPNSRDSNTSATRNQAK